MADNHAENLTMSDASGFGAARIGQTLTPALPATPELLNPFSGESDALKILLQASASHRPEMQIARHG